jgi:hypothetical protein
VDHKRKDPLRRRCALAYGLRDLIEGILKKEQELKHQDVHLEMPASIGRLGRLLSGQLLRAAEPAGHADCTELIDRGLEQRARALLVAGRAAP